jgi:DNA-directed RNA polymerase
VIVPVAPAVPLIEGYRRQCYLEKEARDLAADAVDGPGWDHAPAGMVVTRHGEMVAQAMAVIVENAKKQPAYLGQVLARISPAAAREMAVDAMLYVLSTVGDCHDRDRMAIQLGIRAESAMLLHQEQWGKSWHREEVVRLVTSNVSIHDLRYRLKRLGLLKSFKPLTEKQRAALGVLLIDLVIDTGLIEYVSHQRMGRYYVDVMPSAAYRTFCGHWRTAARQAALGRWPMVRPPAPWSSCSDGGYYTQAEQLHPAGELRFQDLMGEAMPLVLDVCNKLQAQPVSLNRRLLGLLRDAWEGNLELGTLPRRVPAHRPESNWRTRATTSYWRQVVQFNLDRKRGTMRTRTAGLLVLAERLLDEPNLYRPVHLDARGRVYYRSGFSQQQPDHIRALLQWPQPASPAQNRMDSGEARGWVAWQLAGYLGVKGDWDEIQQWFNAKLPSLLDLARNLDTDLLDLAAASDPWCAAALLWELLLAENGGRQHSFRHLFRLDQSCSGYGHLAALTWDQQLAMATNVVGRVERRDLYHQIRCRWEALLERALVEEQDPKQVAALELVRRIGLERSIVKEAVMPLIYGATMQSVRHALLQGYRLAAGNVVTEDGVRPMAMAVASSRLLWRAAHEEVPGLGSLGRWLQSLARLQIEAGMVPHWWTPDGMKVESFRQDTDLETVELLARGGRKVRLVMSLRPDGWQEKPAKLRVRKTLSAVGPDFVHSMDAAFLRHAVAGWDGPIEVIHDCFATDLDHIGKLNQHLLRSFASFYADDHMGELHRRAGAELPQVLRMRLPPPPRVGKAPLKGIGSNPYLFS